MLFGIQCFENRSQTSVNLWFCFTFIETPFFSDAWYISLTLFSKLIIICVSSIFCTVPFFPQHLNHFHQCHYCQYLQFVYIFLLHRFLHNFWFLLHFSVHCIWNKITYTFSCPRGFIIFIIIIFLATVSTLSFGCKIFSGFINDKVKYSGKGERLSIHKYMAESISSERKNCFYSLLIDIIYSYCYKIIFFVSFHF